MLNAVSWTTCLRDCRLTSIVCCDDVGMSEGESVVVTSSGETMGNGGCQGHFHPSSQ